MLKIKTTYSFAPIPWGFKRKDGDEKIEYLNRKTISIHKNDAEF